MLTKLYRLVSICVLCLLFSGCGKHPAPVKVTAYINVSSGCQAETVNLLNKLAADYAGLVDLEIVDFGSSPGQERWANAGLNCMTILFNDSPVVKFPDAQNQTKVVAFFMPAGFSWTHEDLEQAFKAVKAGTLEILTEEQARRELTPKPLELKVSVQDLRGAARLEINQQPIFTVKAKAHGKTPLQRVTNAKSALEKWASTPIHVNQLSLVPHTSLKSPLDDISIMANDIEIIQVTKEDARQAGVKTTQSLARKWLKALKACVIEQMGTPVTGTQ